MEPIKELADHLYRQRVLEARAMDPAEKLLAGLRLFDYACRITADGIRHQFPGISEERVREILVERLELARRLENRQ